MGHPGIDDSGEGEPDTETSPPTGFPVCSLGSAELQIDISEETYERLHAEYLVAVEHGYTDGFETFAYNYCSIDESYVTVDGEPVDPDRESND